MCIRDRVYPGTTVGAAHALTKGSVTLDKLMDLEGKQSILDQLLQGCLLYTSRCV